MYINSTLPSQTKRRLLVIPKKFRKVGLPQRSWGKLSAANSSKYWPEKKFPTLLVPKNLRTHRFLAKKLEITIRWKGESPQAASLTPWMFKGRLLVSGRGPYPIELVLTNRYQQSLEVQRSLLISSHIKKKLHISKKNGTSIAFNNKKWSLSSSSQTIYKHEFLRKGIRDVPI